MFYRAILFSNALNQAICVVILLVVAFGTTFSAIGEFRSHSLLSAVEIGHGHSHSHSHSHQSQGEYQSHHDASNHSHDNANLREQNLLAFAQLIQTEPNRCFSGFPVRHPFKIERPPRALLLT